MIVSIKSNIVSWENTTEKLWYENGKKCYNDFELAGGCECLENWEQCPSDVSQPITELMLSPKCFDWVESIHDYCIWRKGRELVLYHKRMSSTKNVVLLT